jgi:hypothetical protein
MATLPRTYSFDEEAPPNDGNQPRFIYSRSISAAVYLSHVRTFPIYLSSVDVPLSLIFQRTLCWFLLFDVLAAAVLSIITLLVCGINP